MSDPTPPPLSDEDARRQREDALSALAHRQLGAPPAASSISSEPPPPDVPERTLVPAHAALFTPPNPQQAYATIRWDTATLSWSEVPPQPRYHDFVSLPPAERYTWSASDQLLPGAPLIAASAPASPVGNPDGSTSFTVWQPGTIALQTQGDLNNQTVPITPGAYNWTTSPLAWSPDGNYLIDSVGMFGLLQPLGQPSPTAAGLRTLGWQDAPTLGIRDPAEQQLLTSLATNPSHGDQLDDALAWSPNGRTLAATPESTTPTSLTANSTSPPVTFYETATGKALVQLQPQPSSQAAAGLPAGISWFVPFALLDWSADSSHFLLFSAALGTITIWGPSKLPQSRSSS